MLVVLYSDQVFYFNVSQFKSTQDTLFYLIPKIKILIQVDIDFESEPIGKGKDGKDVYFKDIWPSSEEISSVSLLT